MGARGAQRLWHEFRQDERGQSLVFAAISLFLMVIVVLAVVSVGEATERQMEMQGAADASAYAAAQVQADCIANVAWLNEAMAAIYYHAVRYAEENATRGVLAEMEDLYDAYPAPEGPGGKMLHLGFSGQNGAAGAWAEAYADAEAEIPRAEKWLKRLSQVQHGIGVLVPTLMEHQARFTAALNGADRNIVYPQGLVYYEPNGNGEPIRRQVVLEKALNEAGLTSWHIYQYPDENYLIAVDHNVQDDATPEWAVEIQEGDDVTTYDEWYWALEPPGQEEHKYVITPADGEAAVIWLWRGTEEIDELGRSLTATRLYWEEEKELILTFYDHDGWTRFDEPGETPYAYRYTAGEDGGQVLEYWRDLNDNWGVDEGERSTVANQSYVTVEGVKVPVTYNHWIHLDTEQEIGVNFASRTLALHGTFWIGMFNGLRATWRTPAGELKFDDDEAVLNRLSTLRHDDGRWRPVENLYGRARGRDRHRMVPRPDITLSTRWDAREDFWLYEWVRPAICMTDMDMRTFAAHAFMNYDEDYEETCRGENVLVTDMEYWMPPDAADDASWTDSAEGRWARMPLFARPAREPQAEDETYGGWFDLARGGPSDPDAFSQTRTCWHCATRGDVAGPLTDHDSSNEFTAGKLCTRPCGFWHEIFADETACDQRMEELRNGPPAGFYADPRTLIKVDQGGGAFLLQVACPLCHRVAPTGSDPNRTFPDPPTFNPDDPGYDGPTAAEQRPTRVRCTLRDACERYKLTDVQSISRNTEANRYLDQGYHRDTDSFDAAPRPGRMLCYQRDFYRVYTTFDAPPPDFETANGFDPPIALTSEAFRHPVVVGVFAGAESLGAVEQVQGEAGEEGAASAFFNPLRHDNPGHFAVAAARVYLPYPPAQAQGSSRSLESDFWALDDPDVEDVKERVVQGTLGDEPGMLDPIDRPYNPLRQEWLRSGFNLFEPGWNAALVPLRSAVSIFDVYADGEVEEGTDVYGRSFYQYTHVVYPPGEGGDTSGEGEEVTDSPTALMMRMLSAGIWRKGVVDEGMTFENEDHRVRRAWNRVDWQDERIEDVVHH